MYKGNKVMCVIPARDGSKGLPGKNIKKLAGKPLIAYTIEHAQQSRYIDRVIVSTDSGEIAGISRQYGAEVPFIRPKELAMDGSSVLDVLQHTIDWAEDADKYSFDILVLLHVTAPLRNVSDIDKCIKLLVDKNADNVFSVAEASRNPYFNMVEIHGDGKIGLVKEGSFVTRQSAPKVFDINGSVYVWWKDVFKKRRSIFLENTQIYIMPKERSVDIDDAIDFKIAEMLLRDAK